MLPQPLKGITVPLVTPLSERDKLDTAGLERLVEHVITGGVHGIFVLGTTGEAPSLSHRLRSELIERVCKQVAGRIPVLVGITDTPFIESVNTARYAYEQGVSALVLAPPYYFASGQPELLEYLGHLTAEVPLPIFLYNMPSHTKVNIEPDTVLKAADDPKIIGLKDSSTNMIYFHKVQELFKDRPDFSLLVGPEELLAETVLLGGHGGVSGGANIFPKLYVKLYEAATAGELETVKKLHKEAIRISMTIYSTGRYGSTILKGIKCSLGLMGICSDFIAEPFHRFREPEREKIRKYLQGIQEYV